MPYLLDTPGSILIETLTTTPTTFTHVKIINYNATFDYVDSAGVTLPSSIPTEPILDVTWIRGTVRSGNFIKVGGTETDRIPTDVFVVGDSEIPTEDERGKDRDALIFNYLESIGRLPAGTVVAFIA